MGPKMPSSLPPAVPPKLPPELPDLPLPPQRVIKELK